MLLQLTAPLLMICVDVGFEFLNTDLLDRLDFLWRLVSFSFPSSTVPTVRDFQMLKCEGISICLKVVGHNSFVSLGCPPVRCIDWKESGGLDATDNTGYLL